MSKYLLFLVKVIVNKSKAFKNFFEYLIVCLRSRNFEKTVIFLMWNLRLETLIYVPFNWKKRVKLKLIKTSHHYWVNFWKIGVDLSVLFLSFLPNIQMQTIFHQILSIKYHFNTYFFFSYQTYKFRHSL